MKKHYSTTVNPRRAADTISAKGKDLQDENYDIFIHNLFLLNLPKAKSHHYAASQLSKA